MKLNLSKGVSITVKQPLHSNKFIVKKKKKIKAIKVT